MYSDRMAVLKAVENLQFMGGGTNTGDALQYVATNVYSRDSGARTDVSAAGLFFIQHPFMPIITALQLVLGCYHLFNHTGSSYDDSPALFTVENCEHGSVPEILIAPQSLGPVIHQKRRGKNNNLQHSVSAFGQRLTAFSAGTCRGHCLMLWTGLKDIHLWMPFACV